MLQKHNLLTILMLALASTLLIFTACEKDDDDDPANSAPVANFEADQTNIAAGESVTFTDQSTNEPITWSWDFGDGSTSTDTIPSHTYNSAGSYTVELTVTNEHGSDTETKTDYIMVEAAGSAPIAAFTADQTNITEGGIINFTDQSTNEPTSWSWDFGDGSTSTDASPSHTYNSAGSYTLELTVTNEHGSDTETKTDYIMVEAAGSAPIATFTADQTNITEGGTINFTDQSTNEPTSWSWDFGDGSTSTDASPSHTYNSAGSYTVELTVTNEHGSDTETKTDYITVENGGTGGTVTDIDGNVYNTVVIGDQEWMAENLKTITYNDGTSIELVENDTDWENNTTGAYCWYNNDQTNYGNTYGALYNWYAVETGNLCPDGWHVPTDEEWTALEDYIASNGHSGSEGTALKATYGWNDNGNGTDDYGFTALPGGFRYNNGTFFSFGYFGLWWSATEDDSDNAWYRSLYYEGSGVERDYNYKESGYSIRCLRDN